MSEKVVLTQEQADAIKEAILIEGGNKGRVLRFQGMSNCTWRNGCSPLNEMSFEKVARALFIGYEVEKPKFQEGDFVVKKDGSDIHNGKLIATYKGENYFGIRFFEDIPGAFIADGLRKATEEEIYWLRELGRDKVPDFHENDVVVDERGLLYTIGNEIDAEVAAEWYSNSNIQGIYPAESFKPFKKEQPK